MGILTGTSTGSKSNLGRYLQRAATPLSILLYFGGLAYFAGILWPAFNHDTYISENALLPGVADEQFYHNRYVNERLENLKQHLKTTGLEKETIPVAWLLKEFTDARLEAYVQNFTINYPLGVAPSFSGRNVFGVVRAPRGSSTEAVVIAIPFTADMGPALAVLLAVAKFCREQVYWAKDLYFVVAEQGELGMQAWLNAYHGKENNEFIMADELPAHSGPIQAGVCLELTETSGLAKAEISYNMINGQLPNLDLFNMINRLMDKHHLYATIFSQTEQYSGLYSYEGYMKLVSTTAQGIVRQAVGPTPGLHSIFGSFNIEAITMRPYAGNYGRVDMSGVARAMEGILRSLNNLLERFHQSFFFYLLVSPNRYISIGVYMPAIGAMLLAPALKACALWAAMIADDEQTDGKETEEKPKRKKDDHKPRHSLWTIAPYVIGAHGFGLLIRLLPDYAHTILPSIGAVTDPDQYAIPAIGLLTFLSFAVPIALKTTVNVGGKREQPSAELFRCICLLELGVVVGSISVLNFGLGFILCVVWVPIFTLISASKRRWLYPGKALLLIMTHPLVLIFVGHLIAMNPPNWMDAEYAIKAISMTKDSIVQTVLANYMFGNWLFTVSSAVLLPIWMQFWTLLHLY